MFFEGMRRAAIKETGSNDAKRVVWAVGMTFFFFFHFLYLLINNFRLYLDLICLLKAGGGRR